MEKNIKGKVLDHETRFKDNLQSWIKTNKAMISDEFGKDCTNDFVQYLNDFPGLEFSIQDFQKRKRIKNNVPDYNRCIAMKCNGERCSRKQKDKISQFCGTHVKGSPHGTITDDEKIVKKTQVNIWLQEINGITRYIDDHSNIYATSDIRNSVIPPKIISKYGKNENGTYYMTKS
tara:strand:+ start:19 stop:543 length:525 start_codon:yes stop_codon:yes gene_type:complete